MIYLAIQLSELLFQISGNCYIIFISITIRSCRWKGIFHIMKIIMTDKRTNLDSESLEALMHLSHRNKSFLLKKYTILLKFGNLAAVGEYSWKEFKSHVKTAEKKEVSSLRVIVIVNVALCSFIYSTHCYKFNIKPRVFIEEIQKTKIWNMFKYSYCQKIVFQISV